MKGKSEKKLKRKDKLKDNLYLETFFSIKSRKEFIDTDYINGVYDAENRQLIRPLTNEEKQWLNKFYKEHLHASFCEEDPMVKKLSQEKKDKMKESIQSLSQQIKDLQKDINKLVITKNKIEKKINKIKEKDLRRQIYENNNARNRCVLNRKKASKDLLYLDDILETGNHPTTLVHYDREEDKS
jgi:seryl-tRNA synthetase